MECNGHEVVDKGTELNEAGIEDLKISHFPK